MPTFVPDLVSAFNLYRVKPETPITVQVLVGDFQTGGTVLQWKGGEMTFPGEDQSQKPVGEDGQDLTNTFLDCTTTVRDIRDETNNTSVTIRLAGGVKPAEFPFSHEVEDEGVVIYALKFFLTS